MNMFDSLVWLGENTVRVSTLLLAAGGVAFLFRRFAARLRYVVWCVAILGALLVPLLTATIPEWDLSYLSPGIVTTDAGFADRLSLEKLEAEIFTASPVAGKGTPGLGGTIATAVLALWVTGMIAVLSWLFTGLVRVGRIARRGTSLTGKEWTGVCERAKHELGLRRRVRLVGSDEVATPITWGIFRPVIVLPDDADRWPEECRHVVLLHELIHVQRFDWFFQVAGQVACAANWFNPIVWIAARRLASEREHACDDDVITSGTRPTRYAEHLLDVAEAMSSPELTPVTALSLAHRSRLEGRLQAILGATRRAVPRGVIMPVLTGMAGIAIAVASFEPMIGVCAIAPDEVELKLKSAAIHAKNGEYKQALCVYESITRSNPERGDVWFKLGYTLHEIGDLDGAVVANLKAATFPKSRATALYNAGCAYALKGNPTMALAALEVASEAGLNNKSWLLQDPDLESLHGNSQFAEIVAKLPDSPKGEKLKKKQADNGKDASVKS